MPKFSAESLRGQYFGLYIYPTVCLSYLNRFYDFSAYLWISIQKPQSRKRFWARGVPVRCVVTDGVTADCSKAGELVENVRARGLIADRAYDSDKIVKNAKNLGMKVVIPPRKNRKVLRRYDKKAYKIRRLVENAFLHLKRWRGVATRYCKNLSSFIAAVQIRCLAVWGNIS